MTLEERTLIDISLNSNSYDTNSVTDLYKEKKDDKRCKCLNKYFCCIGISLITSITFFILFLTDTLKKI
jgi:hypothetical protein